MTAHPDGWEPDDVDPTGVRDLLRSLPDPGPMPAHLSARIADSLALEQARRVAPVDFQVPGPRRYRRTPALVAAAAVAALAGFGALSLSGMPHSVVAALTKPTPATTPSAADLASSARAGLSERAGQPATSITMSGQAFDLQVLRTRAASAFPATPTLPPLAGESPSLGPIATAVGAAACAQAVGLRPQGLRVDLGFLDAEPAALLLGSDRDGVLTAFVVQRNCTTGQPHVLRGPLPQP